MIDIVYTIIDRALWFCGAMVSIAKLLGGGRIRGMKIQLSHKFVDIISLENLLAAWQEFIVGKRHRLDVQEFNLRLMDNIILLHHDLLNHKYQHGGYEAFKIADPKPRQIHKASVRDRLLHHAIYRILYPFFDRTFINDSYSCRLDKGTHLAMDQFRSYFLKVSHHNSRTCWVLKGDIRKFFVSIDHGVLLGILAEYIPDGDIMELLENIINSFDLGLPLGNLTSQLFANVYLNRFDQFVKHQLGAKYYLRYADDFVILSGSRESLCGLIDSINYFLFVELKLELHPDKLFLQTIASGVDFLGWVHFPDHRVLRSASKRRMFRKIGDNNLSSYLGLLSHGNAKKLVQVINNFSS